ncbi:MAG: hypothetical protein IJ257_07355 [Treponema sp.]|nr:hypothetical protein [Treponema sp.]
MSLAGMQGKSKERIFVRKFSYESKNPRMDFLFEEFAHFQQKVGGLDSAY